MKEKRYRKNDSVLSRKIGDEFILVPIKQDAGDLSSIYTLNEVAARVWELVDGNSTMDDIQGKIAQEYEADGQALAEDIIHYLKQLESKGLITEA